MVITLLIASVFFLGLIAIAIYFWQKPTRNTETPELPPPPVTSLFADEQPALVVDAPENRLLEQQPTVEDDDQHETKRAAAEEFIETWKQSPGRNSTAQMFHLAAAADDAEIYERAAELALNLWQDGKLPDVSATELQALLNSEYWLLSAQTRNSGAGFVLKRTLSRARRELESVNHPH